MINIHNYSKRLVLIFTHAGYTRHTIPVYYVQSLDFGLARVYIPVQPLTYFNALITHPVKPFESVFVLQYKSIGVRTGQLT